MKCLFLTVAALLCTGAGQIASAPKLGTAEGKCRPNEPGPAFLVRAEGMKDRKGDLKVEVYPDNDHDFLADDNVLIAQGKTFRRVVVPVPRRGSVEACIRVPHPGTYSLSILHDRDANQKFGLSSDGVGFPGNPKLGWSKPKADQARATAGSGVTPIAVRMNYRHGLFSFGPIGR